MSRHGENIRRREDGRWEARFVFRPAAAEKKVTKSFYGNTYGEAKEKRNTFIEEMNRKSADIPVPRICPTLREVASGWLHTKQPDIKESTAARYSNVLILYIFPTLGDHTMDNLDSECVNNFLGSLLQHGRKSKDSAPSNPDTDSLNPRADKSGHHTQTKGLSAKTVADIKSILLAVCKYALMLKIISSIPEFRKIPRTQTNTEVLTAKEQSLLESILFNLKTPICLICILSLYTGIRIGEACGLQWKDIDLINGTISVTKTVLRITNTGNTRSGKTKVVIQTPKSLTSIRTIPIPDTIWDYLVQNKAEKDIYLATGTTEYTEPRKCQYHFKKILKLANIRNYKFHALRHTFATRCIENGVDVKSLSEIMGHSSVTITMQRYVHPSLEMKRTQLNKLKKAPLPEPGPEK
ncbi:MAG: site-specific integrase [Lachnospiraceae bacterium]|nr:site-specific integrase [Lachnospiraceae bacterium]